MLMFDRKPNLSAPAKSAEAGVRRHSTVADVLSSQHKKLDPSTQKQMGKYFHFDFGRVRIFDNSEANDSAAALEANAYTIGPNVVFGRGAYGSKRSPAVRLLAHELTHVVQQHDAAPGPVKLVEPNHALEGEARDAAANLLLDPLTAVRPPISRAGAFSLQRDPIAGKRESVPGYEVEVGDDDVPRQVKTAKQVGSATLKLSYDPATSTFDVTFPLIWIFVHEWTDEKRDAYVQDFEKVVLKTWNDRFPLVESGGKKRKAHVKISFDEKIVHQNPDSFMEARELSQNESGRWTMDVRNLRVRENVKHGFTTVELGEGSNKPATHSAKELRARASAVYGGAGGNRSFTQTASAHEFGHMIGLGDEYVKDVGEEAPPASRMLINARIMNVGGEVTRDAYAPFAEWLSDLTSSTWTVGLKK